MEICGTTLGGLVGRSSFREPRRLVSAVSGDHCYGSPKKNFDVQPDGPRTRVLQIHADHVVKLCAAATINLPQSGYTRLDFQNAATVPSVVGLELILDRRARPNQRHFAYQHIPELWDFIQTRLAQNAANRSDARIFLNLERRRRCSIAIRRLNLTGNETTHVFLVNLAVAILAHGAKL